MINTITQIIPANVPDRWDAPVTVLTAFLVIGYVIREWAKAKVANRHADGELIKNLQRERDAKDKALAEKDKSLEHQERQNDQLLKVNNDLLHQLRNLRWEYDLVITEVNKYAPKPLQEKVGELLVKVREAKTERRADRGDVPLPEAPEEEEAL